MDHSYEQFTIVDPEYWPRGAFQIGVEKRIVEMTSIFACRRSFCFHKNLLLVVQNRSETEEQVTIEGFSDSTVWDVYLEANTENLNLKV